MRVRCDGRREGRLVARVGRKHKRHRRRARPSLLSRRRAQQELRSHGAQAERRISGAQNGRGAAVIERQLVRARPIEVRLEGAQHQFWPRAAKGVNGLVHIAYHEEAARAVAFVRVAHTRARVRHSALGSSRLRERVVAQHGHAGSHKLG